MSDGGDKSVSQDTLSILFDHIFSLKEDADMQDIADLSYSFVKLSDKKHV